VARILIVGGGCRGRRLASELTVSGSAVRVSTRTEAGRAAIEAAGAECWVGTPNRLATMRGALENVTVLCWLLGSASGPLEELRELHTSRLEFFLTQAIDTTVRGLVYESRGAGAAPPQLLLEGARIARALAERNSIPARELSSDPDDLEAWLAEAHASIDSLLGRG
jgi:uncharacterized protein YbjT (DUF2867 family)